MGDTVFAALQLRNVICLEEITDVFPFVGKPWNGSKIDALHMMSLILRTHRFVGIDESTLSPERIVYTKKVGNAITCMSEATEPPQLWFLTQYYKPNNLQREKEIKII